MRFMSNQKRAHDFNRHIILSSEARETAVLVKRFIGSGGLTNKS